MKKEILLRLGIGAEFIYGNIIFINRIRSSVFDGLNACVIKDTKLIVYIESHATVLIPE